jgi:hypothetical protein
MSVAQPLASDEDGRRNFNFQVYFRPGRAGSGGAAGLTEKERNLVDLPDTSRRSCGPELMKQNRTCYCNFVAGHGTHGDANCRDEIHMKAIRQPV